MLLRLLFVALIITASGCVSSLFSETVKLINGKAIFGDLIKVADETVSVESKGEEVIIRKDRIQSIVFQSDIEDVNMREIVLVSTTLTHSDAHKRKHYAIGFEVAQDADPRLNSIGGSLYIQHVWKSGIGVQANLGGYTGVEKYRTQTKRAMRYTLPLIIHIHLLRELIISPFGGIGVALNEYKACPPFYKEMKKTGVSPLADIGFVFGGDSPMRVVCDLKYFVSLYTSKANMLTGGIGVSINW